MKKINYPARGSIEFNSLCSDYISLFSADFAQLERLWSGWKHINGVTKLFPETVESILVADVDVISSLFHRFKSLNLVLRINRRRNPVLVKLDEIFDYSNKYADRIAQFFIDRADQLHICSCYYCETSYINVYTLKKRQFDLDHFIPKEKCPLLGLSLFNYVPCCQVCNSRIKTVTVVGDSPVEYVRFNPAGEDYSFDDNVSIRLRMNPGFRYNLDNPQAYYVYFRSRMSFEKVVGCFHLEERYGFHKLEALRIKKLQAQYPISARKKISRLLGFSEAKVKEDLFHERYLDDNNRCFAKLTRDMLK